MKIIHLMLFNFYIDDAFYQENILPRQNKLDGHDILIIASTFVFAKGNSTKFIPPGEYYSKEGIKIVRVPYRNIINNKISEKIRAYKDIYQELQKFNPDIIFCHGIGGFESKTIAQYIHNNKKTKLYIDCHSDYFNSATNFLSKIFLHRFFYRFYFNKLEKYAEKIYYIAPETKKFLGDLYRYNNTSKLEYFPLGGYLIDKDKRSIIKQDIRRKMNISKNDIVFIHTGKFDEKKKSFELICAFNKLDSKNIRLLILGDFNSDIYLKVRDLINQDKRILFLGWKTGDELQEYLCASDVYLQPGSRTVTVQNAICCGCAVVVNRSLIYTDLLGDIGLYAETENEIYSTLKNIIANPAMISQQQNSLFKIAKEKLDYRVLANKYIEHSKFNQT